MVYICGLYSLNSTLNFQKIVYKIYFYNLNSIFPHPKNIRVYVGYNFIITLLRDGAFLNNYNTNNYNIIAKDKKEIRSRLKNQFQNVKIC